MKNQLRRLAFGLVLLPLLSCDKALGRFSFPVEDTQEVTIPQAVPPNQLFPLTSVPVSSTSTVVYTQQGISADNVQDVTLEQLTLSLVRPVGQTFNFLRRVEVLISVDPQGREGRLLASATTIPRNATQLTLTPSAQKLDVYLKGDTYTLTTRVELAEALPADVTFRTSARYHVKAHKP